jgi:hypothetical protein
MNIVSIKDLNPNSTDMRKRISLTILEQAKIAVPEFEKIIKKFSTQIRLKRQSKSSLVLPNNYI